MNIHEHQAKAVLKEFGAPVANGVAVFSVDEAPAAIDTRPPPPIKLTSCALPWRRAKSRAMLPLSVWLPAIATPR